MGHRGYLLLLWVGTGAGCGVGGGGPPRLGQLHLAVLGDICAQPPAGGCAIGGYCFAGGDLDPGNRCLSCQPDVSNTDWTNVPGCKSSAATAVGCQTTYSRYVDAYAGVDKYYCGDYSYRKPNGEGPCKTLGYLLGALEIETGELSSTYAGVCNEVVVFDSRTDPDAPDRIAHEHYPIHLPHSVGVDSDGLGICFPGEAGKNVFDIDIPAAAGNDYMAAVGGVHVGGCRSSDPVVADGFYVTEPASLNGLIQHATTAVHVDSGGSVGTFALDIDDVTDGVICRSDRDPTLPARYNSSEWDGARFTDHGIVASAGCTLTGGGVFSGGKYGIYVEADAKVTTTVPLTIDRLTGDGVSVRANPHYPGLTPTVDLTGGAGNGQIDNCGHAGIYAETGHVLIPTNDSYFMQSNGCNLEALAPGVIDTLSGPATTSATCGCTAGLNQCSPNECSNPLVDPLNCGACGHACGSGERCTAGQCSSCPAGQLACDSSNVCLDLTHDATNCGACGHVCDPGVDCISSACVCVSPPCVAPPPPPPPPACGVMNASTSPLLVGNPLSSCNGLFALTLQSDGNLVLYRTGVGALWASGTTSGVEADIEGDGTFVIRDYTYKRLWTSGSPGQTSSNYQIVVQDDGNVILAIAGGSAVWQTNTSDLAGTTPPTECGKLHPNQALSYRGTLSSCDGVYTLGMWGTLGLNHNNTNIWTAGNANGRTLTMQDDGNLVIYDGSGRPLWASNTNGHPGAGLSLQADGNLVVYDQGRPIWASGTNGR